MQDIAAYYHIKVLKMNRKRFSQKCATCSPKLIFSELNFDFADPGSFETFSRHATGCLRSRIGSFSFLLCAISSKTRDEL